MKKVFIPVIFILIFSLLVGCSSENDDRIKMPSSSKKYKGANYQEVVSELHGAGFTNVQTEVLDDLVTGWLTKDGEVEQVSVDGDTTFSTDSKYSADVKILVTYHTYPEKPENETNPKEESDTTKQPVNNSEEVLTSENNEDFASVLSTKNEVDPICKDFAEKYRGKTIEFDGHISDVAPYKDYDTRFNVLIYVGDYRTDNFYGPRIKMENVGVTHYPEIERRVNQNVRVTGKVIEYDEDTGLLWLSVVSIEER